MTSDTEHLDNDHDTDSGSRFFGRWRIALGALVVLLLIYFTYATLTFSVFYNRDLSYPQQVLAAYGLPDNTGGGTIVVDDAEREECVGSRTVSMQIWLIDHMIEDNHWVPAHPLYKAGFAGLVDFEPTPFFDNKASEQLGMLDIARRLAIELTDSLGRVRGTSAENEDLDAAQSALRVNEQAWYLNNPLDSRINTVSVSAAASFERARDLYEGYNRQLASCEAVFDARADNLRETLSRFTAALGGTTAELGARSRSVVYDPAADRFVDGPGNDYGWFDFRADNLFHRARGQMFALHGILQGMREDFHEVIEDRNSGPVWDRMEQFVAEAARMDPLIVSNGAPDSAIAPAHLDMIVEKILRARTSMVELRDVLQN